LPVPAGHDPEPLKADALPGAEQVLSPVTRLRILQDGAATEFDYGGSLLAVYKDGARAEARDGTVHAAWNGDAFEVEHRFDGGTKITETYKLAASGEELHWVVHLKQKGADAIAIERVFERDGAR